MEVNKIIQTLHSIVYKLSMSQSAKNVDVSQEMFSDFHHEEMWSDDDYINLSMSVSQDFNNNSSNISEWSSEIGGYILEDFELFTNHDTSASEEENE